MPARATGAAFIAATFGAVILAGGVADVGPASAVTNPTIASLTFTAPGGSLYYPEGIATNNNGTVYVSNTNDNVVASIVGTLDSTIAGSYEGSGESGDGGLATAATLSRTTSPVPRTHQKTTFWMTRSVLGPGASQ